jgi:pantoate--beta-alanine ligase
VRELYSSGERSAETLLAAAVKMIEAEPAAVIDYLELRDATSLEAVVTVSDTSLLALAVKIGTTRLIDNILLGNKS